ncbi:MOSC domain-containing protein [Nocardiopsis suaedae]|uniref:MOSC domain-containing protein n=1 Tax=Nocardiopsis suaedae TaxID=3018444 RepID=A0ABT4TLG6_9ACTN|nr:MOSC domain-containing protein [Nocardiopsis suaedae]MDA2805538.1 MOSC domain-containing protein [Nocardiopsis suaedae]
MHSEGTIASVNTGPVIEADWAGRMKRTAIDKRSAAGAVVVGLLGLDGDDQADREHHGGPDKAVYAYAREDLDAWQARLGRPLRDGAFGENLTTVGVDVTGAVIGEQWRVGTTLLEVTLPRTPCRVFQAWIGENHWVTSFTEEGRFGVYLRVLDEGRVRAGDPVEVVHRPDHGITSAAGFAAGRAADVGLLERIVALPDAATAWKEVLDRARARRARSGADGGESRAPGTGPTGDEIGL